jgi:hypothetical protein
VHELGSDCLKDTLRCGSLDVLEANFVITSRGSEEAVVNSRPGACLNSLEPTGNRYESQRHSV